MTIMPLRKVFPLNIGKTLGSPSHQSHTINISSSATQGTESTSSQATTISTQGENLSTSFANTQTNAYVSSQIEC